MFTASVTSNFDATLLQNYENEFGTKSRVRQLYRLTVPDDTPLDETFRQDLYSIEPDELFTKYGTHVLKSFVVGGRFEYMSYVEKQTNEEKFNFKASIDAGFENVFTAKGGGGSENTEAEKKVMANAKYNVWGGETVEGTFQQWFSGINEKNAAIAEFEKESLVPLYALVRDSPTRQALLTTAHGQYMKKYAAPVMLEPDPTAPPAPATLTPLKYGDRFRLKTADDTFGSLLTH